MHRATRDKVSLFVQGDVGDSTSAGASGDVPFACRRLLALESNAAAAAAAEGSAVAAEGAVVPTVLIAGMVDAAAVAVCTRAGEGNTLPTLTIGAGHAPPHLAGYGADCELVLPDVTVLALANRSDWAIVHASRHITVALQRCAWAFYNRSDLERLPLVFRPNTFDVTIFSRPGVNVEDLAKLATPAGGPSIRCALASDTPGANTFPLRPRRHVLPDTYEQWAPRPSLEWNAPLGAVLD
jgi:microcystin degradation protein MlrC